jgi:hypothetical protein
MSKRAPPDFTKLNVILIEHKKKLQGETKSKFLDPDSDLYFHIYDCQQRIKHAGIRFESRLEPHVELISNTESKKDPGSFKEVFLARAKELHMKEVDVTDKTIYKIVGKTLVMKLPSLSDKEISIKIAHFSYLPPHIDRLVSIIFDPQYSPYSDWEQTVFD